MATMEELREELEQERAARQELDAALQEAAKYGQELLVQVQEQEQALAEYREKVQRLEETPYKSQASSSRRMSQNRRASTVAFGSDRRVAFLPGTADSDDEDGKRPAKPTQRRGRGGKSMMVEDLMQHNQSLEEDVRRLQQKLNEEMEEDSDEEEGQIRPKRRSRKGSRALELDQTEEEEMEEDYEAQTMELQQQLQAARKESATRQKALEAELDAKKQELQEHFQAEQDAKASNAQIEAKLKALQKQWDILVQQKQQVEEELQNAKTKERELTFLLEQQTLRNEVRHSRRNWMPTACEEALRNAAAQPSLADEFQDMEGEEEEDEKEDHSEKGDLQNHSNQAGIEALQLELQSVQAGATKEIHQLKERHDASQAESTKEIKELQEKLAATKAEAAASLQEQKTLQEQTQAVLAENARLRKEVQILEEANEVRTNGEGGTRSEEVEESFWSKVLGSIACARTTPKPSTSPRRNPELQMGLAMPQTEQAAAAVKAD